VNRRVIDVSELPEYAFGHRNIMWWGGASLMVIESTMFLLLFTSYIYLKSRAPEWPPGYFPPLLFWGSVNTVILLASSIPNQLAKKAAEQMDLGRLRLWLGVSIVFGVAFGVVRVFEFGALNVWWDSNAYGSIVWVLLGFHTTHVITDIIDSVAMEVLLFTGPLQEAHFVDAAENSLYWHYVVVTWLPVYGFIYLAPRLT
jgi:cytochrome c oxidase subunit 3